MSPKKRGKSKKARRTGGNGKIMLTIIGLLGLCAIALSAIIASFRNIMVVPTVLQGIILVLSSFFVVFLFLLIIFIVYQMDKSLGKIKRSIPFFELDLEGGGG